AIIAAMCHALGRPAPRFAVPTWMALSGGKLLDKAAALAGKRLNLSTAMGKYLEEVVVSGEKITEIGFLPQLDLAAGWELTVRELRDLGQLEPAAHPV